MRRLLGWICAAMLVLAVAACDEKDEKGKSKTGGEDLAIDERIEKYCDDAAEFIADVEADPTDTDLFDEGEPIFEEGGDLIEEAEDPEDVARAEECTQEVAGALADIEVEPTAT